MTERGVCYVLEGKKDQKKLLEFIRQNKEEKYKNRFEEFEKMVFELSQQEYEDTLKDKYDTCLIQLISALGKTEEEKLECLGIKIEAILEETEKITGSVYRKKEKGQKKSELSAIPDTDASDFFANLAKE